MKIIVVQRVLPNYRKQLLEVMREECIKIGDSFELWVSSPSQEFSKRNNECVLPWMRLLSVKSLPYWLGGFEYQFILWREILAADVVIVSDNLRCISNFLVILLRRFKVKPVLVWGHGVNFQSNLLSSLFSGLRMRLLSLANFNIVYTQACLPPMIAAGFNPNRIGVSENNIDTSQALGLHSEHPEVLAFREAHFLGDAPCVVFLGSWHSRKRPELLIEIGLALRRLVPHAQVLVIGGGDCLHVLEKQAKELPWLKLLGPLFDREKFVALASASCMIVSGMVGLNLLDAMAVGLPVLIPKRDDHSPEVAYLLDGINGLILPDNIEFLAEASRQLIVNKEFQANLSNGARRTSSVFTLKDIAQNILRFAVNQIDKRPVVFVYQRMLPYHRERFRSVSKELHRQGRVCVAVQVAKFDSNYGELSDELGGLNESECSVVTLFNTDYLNLKPREVTRAMFGTLRSLEPSIIFAPAPAFSEGAASLHYKIRHNCRLILMDDAWSMTARRNSLIHLVKKNFYRYMDGGFFPSQLHGNYFATLNIPHKLQSYNLNVVGAITKSSSNVKEVDSIYPEHYLLFVGRLIERKGLDVLLRAFTGVTPLVYLVVIGDGPERESLEALSSELGLAERVQWLGRLSNNVTRLWMAKAQAVLIPSKYEQWGLVANEAWLMGTLVLGSDTVGALRSEYNNDMNWMMVPYGDVKGWQYALALLLALLPEEKAPLINETKQLAAKNSMTLHTQSILKLISLPKRQPPIALIGWLACSWHGRTVIW